MSYFIHDGIYLYRKKLNKKVKPSIFTRMDTVNEGRFSFKQTSNNFCYACSAELVTVLFLKLTFPYFDLKHEDYKVN